MHLQVTSPLLRKTPESKLFITATNKETLLTGELTVTKKSQMQEKALLYFDLGIFTVLYDNHE